MLLRRLMLTAMAVSATTSLVAAEGDAGHGSVEFGLGFYQSTDGNNGADGNPFLDEEMTVIEPVVIFNYHLDDRNSIWAKASYDYVSSASIERLSRYPAQSGATADYYVGLDLGYRRETLSGDSWGLSGGFSVEYDYRSFGLGGDYTHHWAGGNSLKWGLNAFVDQLDVIRYNGEQQGTDTRLSLSGRVDAYQALTPLTHVGYGAVLTFQEGFLETAYNAVVIEDTATPNPALVGRAAGREVTEELDSTRVRGALHGRIRRSLTDMDAVELGGRLYADSWGIGSVAVEPRWYRWLIPDQLRLRLRYRFYTQTEADDYSGHYTVETPLRTQDSDLAAFTSHSVGALFTITTGDQSEWDIGADYVLRDDDLDEMLGRIGYRREF